MMKYLVHFWTTLFLVLASIKVYANEQKELIIPNNLEELKDSIGLILKEHNIPGAGIALVHSDSVIWSGGIGLADIEHDIPVEQNTLFRVGSITKTFVALGIMKLVEDGKLSLQDKLSEIIPEIRIENPWESTEPLKLVHLLEHTSGFDDMHFNEFLSPEGKTLTAQEALSINHASRRVRWKPGTRMSYSNPGYAVAGYVLEKYSGKRFEDYLKENVLLPLGMKGASFELKDINLETLSNGYVFENDKPRKVEYQQILFRWAGSLHASPNDLATFTRLLLNRGKHDTLNLLQPESIERMERPTTTLAASAGLDLGYGLGNYSMVKGPFKHYGHSGGIMGFISRFRYIPEKKVGYVVLLNAVHSKAYRDISDLLVAYMTKTNEIEESSESINIDANRYIGLYANKNPRNEIFSGVSSLTSALKIQMHQDTLYTKSIYGDIKKLIPVSDNIFRYKDRCEGHILFTTDEDGKQILVNVDGIENYYEKSSALLFNIKFYSFIAGGILTILLLPISMIWWILYWIRKINRNTIYRDHLMMTIGLLCLMMAIIPISNVSLEQIPELGQVGWRTVVFFITTVLYAFFMLLGSWFGLQNFKHRKGFWKYYIMLLMVFNIELIILLYQWNIIGLRLWAW